MVQDPSQGMCRYKEINMILFSAYVWQRWVVAKEKDCTKQVWSNGSNKGETWSANLGFSQHLCVFKGSGTPFLWVWEGNSWMRILWLAWREEQRWHNELTASTVFLLHQGAMSWNNMSWSPWILCLSFFMHQTLPFPVCLSVSARMLGKVGDSLVTASSEHIDNPSFTPSIKLFISTNSNSNTDGSESFLLGYPSQPKEIPKFRIREIAFVL